MRGLGVTWLVLAVLCMAGCPEDEPVHYRGSINPDAGDADDAAIPDCQLADEYYDPTFGHWRQDQTVVCDCDYIRRAVCRSAGHTVFYAPSIRKELFTDPDEAIAECCPLGR